MRSLVLVLPASLMFVASVHGQVLTEHAASVAGATIGSGAGKSLSNSVGKIFGDMDKATAKAAKPEAKAAKPEAQAAKPETKKESKPSPVPDPQVAKSKAPMTSGGDGGFRPLPPVPSHSASQPHSRTARKPIPQDETAVALTSPVVRTPVTTAPLIVRPIVKVPTVQDIASIKVGTTEDDLVAALGQPSSRVSIPDDDGHLRETCQYWADGRQIGTIRLDNGQVVTVETRPEN